MGDMAEDPQEQSTDSLSARWNRRGCARERGLLALVVVAIVFVRYGYEATLTYAVLPLCLFGIAKPVADVILTTREKGRKAAAQAMADRAARVVLLGLVSVFIVGTVRPHDEDPPLDPCLGEGLNLNPDPACGPSTTTTSTTQSPQYVPTTITDPGRPTDPECPPPGNQERRLSFTATPPFCLNREMDYVATIETNYGSFDIALNMDGAPWTVNNFAFLAGWHFYDGVPLSRPSYLATSVLVGDPVDPSDVSAAPGYGLTFDTTNPPYPEDPYVVMVDPEHPNRFEVAISRSRRAEIEARPGSYPLLGEVLSGDGVIFERTLGDLVPDIHSNEIVIKSVTVREVPQQ